MSHSKIQSAKKLLQINNVSPAFLTPKTLVSTANSIQQSLDNTLNLIAYLKTGGANYSQFPQTAKLLTGQYE